MKILFNTYYNQRNTNSVKFEGKTSNITTEYLLQLINSGKTVREIKKELGIATDTYYKLLRERGISYNKQPLSQQLKDISQNEIESLLQQGYTVPNICEILKITANAYYRLIENFGIRNPKSIISERNSKITAEQLKSNIEAGLSVKEICDSLEISADCYYRLLQKFNITTAKKQAKLKNASITKEQLVELLDSGKSMHEIVRELGITEATYISLIAKFGINTNFKMAKQNISSITKEKLQSLVDSGKSVKDICQELKIPERTYSRLLDKFGIITSRKASKTHISSIQANVLQELVDAGYTPDEICKQLKINNSMFYRLLKRLKIDYNYMHHYKEIIVPKQSLIDFVNSNKTTKEIPSILYISSTTYYERVKSADVKTIMRDNIDKIASVSKKQLQDSINQGMSIKEICEKFNITGANYTALIRKYNIQTKQRISSSNISTVTKEQILDMRKAGKKIKEICNELNISERTYRRVIDANSEA